MLEQEKQTIGTARNHDVFCVCDAHCTHVEGKKGTTESCRRRGRRSGREKRKVRQRPVVPWRAIYRTPDFFPSFFIPTSRAPGGPLRLSFAFCLRRKSPHACSSSSLLPLVLFLCTDRPTNVPSPSSSSPSPFSLDSLPHVRVPGHSFVESLPFLFFRCRSSWRGGGAVRRDAHADGKREKRTTRRNYSERKVVRLMKSQFSVLPFADSIVSLTGLGKSLWGKNACA